MPKKTKKSNFIFAVGRRKRAIARVRLFRKPGELTVNDKPIGDYFPGQLAKKLYLKPFEAVGVIDRYSASVKVVGSGPSGQLVAVTHGLSRALVKANEDKFKPLLKKYDLLTRDPRKRQRRQAGKGGKSRRQKQSPKR